MSPDYVAEALALHPRLIQSRRAGYQLPERSLHTLLDHLRGVDRALLGDPVTAAQLLPQLAPRCTHAALRAFCWAYVGQAAADLFQPSRVWFGNPAEDWQLRGAVLLAGMRGPDPWCDPRLMAVIAAAG